MNPYFLESFINSLLAMLIIVIIGLLLLVLIMILRGRIREREFKENTNQLNLYRNTFYALTNPSLIIKKDGEIVKVNDAAAEFFDRDREDMVGTKFDTFNLILSSPKMKDELREAMANNKSYTFDTSFNVKGGNVNAQILVINVPVGNNSLFLLKVLPEQSVQVSQLDYYLSEERLNKIEDVAEVGFFIFYHDTNEVQWSRGMYNLFKLPINKTMPSLDFLRQLHVDDMTEVNNILLSIKNQTPYSKRIKVVDNDGLIHHVDLQISHQEGINRRNNVSIGTLKNVNTLDQILENFNSREGNLNFVRYPNFFYITLTDSDGKIININESFLNFIDLEKEEVMGTDFRNLLKVKAYKKVGDDYVLRTDKDKILYLKRLPMKNNNEYEITLNLIVQLDEKMLKLPGPVEPL